MLDRVNDITFSMPVEDVIISILHFKGPSTPKFVEAEMSKFATLRRYDEETTITSGGEEIYRTRAGDFAHHLTGMVNKGLVYFVLEDSPICSACGCQSNGKVYSVNLTPLGIAHYRRN